jgi:carnosine N-methyltransferase
MTFDHDEERRHFNQVLHVFSQYHVYSIHHHRRRMHDFMALPMEHKTLIKEYPLKLRDTERCITTNASFLNRVVTNTSLFSKEHTETPIVDGDMDRVRSTLKQCVRDWSTEGHEERVACYQPILDALDTHLPPSKDKGSLRVLVPGAGLGRLVYEVAHRGWSCQGNEFSLYMARDL